MPSDQVARLIKVLSEQDAGGRDQLLFYLLASTGIRVGTAVALEVEDVNLETGRLLLRSMKGDQPSSAWLDKQAVQLLESYLAKGPGGPLFVGRGERAIGSRQVCRRMKHWCEVAEIPGVWSPHALRHAFAMDLYERSADLALVQAALHHRRITSTQVYARPTDERLKAMVSGRIL